MIHHLTVTNFRAIRGTKSYPLSEGVTALIGKNEAGKSSTFLALAYALYGAQAMPDGIDADDLINDHAKALSVTVRFEHNGDEYVLTRSQRQSGTGDATLTRNGQPFASGRAPVTQAITQLFGVDHVGFLISVFARQDELDALAGKRGAERVTTMLRLVGMDQAEAAVKGIRKEANDERRQLDLLRAGVVDVDDLSIQKGGLEADLSALRATVAEDEREVRNRTQAIEGLRLSLSELSPQLEALLAWQEKRAAAVTALSTAKARAEDARGRINVIPPEPVVPTLIDVEEVDDATVQEAEEGYGKRRESWSVTGAALRAAQTERDNLTDICIACNRPFDDAEQVAEHRRALSRSIEELSAKLASAVAYGEAAKDYRDSLIAKRGKAQLARIGNERKQAAYDQAVRDRQAAIERNDAAEAEAETMDEAYRVARDEKDAIDAAAPPDPTQLEKQISEALRDEQELIHAAEKRIASTQANITAAESNIARIQADLDRAALKSAEIAAAERRVVTLDVAAKEMVAMKERLIGRIIPDLELRASAIVADLTDGKHSEVHLTADYEIQYRTETGGLRSFSNLSGGAQRVFALALRLAIAELRAGSVSFLCLDEVFAAIDDERQGLAWEAIERLRKRYQQILLITHVEALRERATNLFVVG